jgi:threonine dehydrogenase-like Zn-dependent dehydrogenase
VEEAIPLEDESLRGRIALALDCSGHEQAVLDACRMVKKGGEVVLTGVPWGRKTDEYAYTLLDIVFHKYAVLRSGWEWEVPRHDTPFAQGSLFGNFAGIMQWIAEGSLTVAGLCGKETPADCTEIYAAMQNREYPMLTAMFGWDR